MEIRRLNEILKENEKIIEDTMNEYDTMKEQIRSNETNSLNEDANDIRKLLQEMQEMEDELYITKEIQTELKCDQCDWTTENKNLMKRHMTSHMSTQEKTHNKKENTTLKCYKCEKVFTAQSSLVQHIKHSMTVHRGRLLVIKPGKETKTTRSSVAQLAQQNSSLTLISGTMYPAMYLSYLAMNVTKSLKQGTTSGITQELTISDSIK